MRKLIKPALLVFKWARYVIVVSFILSQAPEVAVSQTPHSLSDINAALEDETDNVIETGRIVANIIVVVSFVLLMLNVAFKVMDNSKATVIFLFILLLRGLYEVVF
jgi:hypothetical protein